MEGVPGRKSASRPSSGGKLKSRLAFLGLVISIFAIGAGSGALLATRTRGASSAAAPIVLRLGRDVQYHAQARASATEAEQQQQQQRLQATTSSSSSEQPYGQQDFGPTTTQPAAAAPLKYPLWWHGPWSSGSGYGSEAINFVLSLLRSGLVRADDILLSDHGGGRSHVAVAALARADRDDLEAAERRARRSSGSGNKSSSGGSTGGADAVAAEALHASAVGGHIAEIGGLGSGSGADGEGQPGGGAAAARPAVVVCHSMPFFYAVPKAAWSAGAPCPPDRRERPWAYSVGRTMYETDRVPEEFARRCNAMDEVWVPSRWQVGTFVASGVNATKIRVVPEGVNTTWLDPALHAPLPDLEQRARLAFGVPWAAKQAAAASGGSSSSSSGLRGGGPYSGAGGSGGRGERPFRFLSSFKWETRKGWDVLLDAFLSEFDGSDAVELYILTHAWEGEPGDARGFGARMAAWAQSRLPERVAAAASFGEGDSGGARRLLGMMGGGSAAEADAAARQREAAEVAYRGMREWAAGRAAELRPRAAATKRRRLLSANSSSIAVQQQQHLQQHQQQQPPPRPPSPSPSPPPSPPLPPPPPRFDTLAWPTVYVIDAHVPDEDYGRLYASADAFVLPSRGEGWGRPHVEAMSMALPVIATNWSGVTEYLDESVGYPIAIEPELVQAEGWQPGLKWAAPSVAHLRRLLRRAVSAPAEARARGQRARQRMVERYSPPVIARVLAAELRRIEAKLMAASAGASPGAER